MAKLHFYYSAMNAGKSTSLLQSDYNYRERGMDTLLYIPMIDDRYGVGKITSRIGLDAHALPVGANFDIYQHAAAEISKNSNIACILVDEAQFLTKEQVAQLCKITDEFDRPVLAYGLRSDFRGELFAGSQYLLAWADVLIELKTICHCGHKATMNMRVDEFGNKVKDGAQVEIGGNDRYIAVCRKHFHEGTTFKQKK
jgi:thymidine kinase